MTDQIPAQAERTNSHKEKVLIIAGDGAFGEQLEVQIRKEGYETYLVKNGVDGLKKIYDLLPHLILLDIVTPGMDGYDILEAKAKESMLARIPLFLMSTQGLPINMKRVPKDSVTEFIMTLHANPADIVSKINRHFGHERSVSDNKENIIKKTLLWVEDDKLIGSILSKKFISSGFQLIHCTNGDEALEALKNVIPDIIILDLLLPGMSGFDILQKIKQDIRLSKLPIMILSNLSKPSDIEKAKLLGARKFLVKAAVSLDQIVSEVMALVR